jgi:hypothetical protein
MTDPDYWLPTWWHWPTDPAAEIPPGLLAIACIRPCFGGGTAVIGGAMRGNTHIASAQQAEAAARQHSVQEVTQQLSRQRMEQVNRNAR